MSTDDYRRALMLREMGITTWTSRLHAPATGDAIAAPAVEVPAHEGHRPDSAAGIEPTPTARQANTAPSVSQSATQLAIAPAGRAAHIGAMDWDQLAATVSACDACGLCRTRKQTVFGVGARNARWMLVGEAPGAEEDARGEAFVGQAGRLLDAMLTANGLKRSADVFIANVLKCRPPGNRDPQPEEVAACEPYLLRQLELVNPDVVVVLGRFAAQSLLATDASIARMRGRAHHIEVAGRRVPVIVTYHPAYLLRTLNDKAKAWADWCLAADILAAEHA
jgi:uracil-DNA glycosylase